MAIIYYVNEAGKFMDDYARSNLEKYFLRSPEFLFGGYGVNLNDPAGDMQRTAEAIGKDSRKRIYHFVIAFPAGKDVPLVKLQPAMDAISAEIGQTFQVFYAIHTDKAHRHVQLMMNAVSYVTHKKFRGDRESLHWITSVIRKYLYYLGEQTTYMTFGKVPKAYMAFDG